VAKRSGHAAVLGQNVGRVSPLCSENWIFMQTLSYLKASGYKVGLLINFGAAKLQIKRLVN